MEEETTKLLDDTSSSKDETPLNTPHKVDNEELNAMLNGSTSPTSSNTEEDHLVKTVDSLQETDPWLQRKTQNK